jgi:HNH endonuclease
MVDEQKIEKFWSRVDKNGPVVPYVGTPCWLWTGSTSGGYGAVRWEGKSTYSHRVSWLITKGEIPPLLYVLHKCDIRVCVNPDHLFLGTGFDNVQDAIAKGRRCGPRERLFRRVLTNTQVLEIRASAETNRALAERYDVGTQTISDVRNFRRWKNVVAQ